jgi:hypothetical protein
LCDDLTRVIKKALMDPVVFAHQVSRLKLRAYQISVARAVAESVKTDQGLSFVVMFPRQSGKNELQAQIECYLLLLLSQTPAEMIKVSPTWKPQSLNAMRRLERVLQKNLLTRAMWAKESGYIYKIGTARIFFLSGAPEANIVGATASTLLEVDEAQDVQVSKFDKDVNPMAASTNATRIFWGTAWTSRTLLARELWAAMDAEKRDGKRRVFVLTAEDVAREVPAYGKFVADQVAKLGRNHPLVRTQFFSEEIDAEGGMFPISRRALMQGEHGRRSFPEAGKVYALLLDVAGEDEGASSELGELQNPKRDSTALTIVEVDLSSLADAVIKAPTYKVVDRRLWTGIKQSAIYGQVRALAELWNARYVVVDATGVGAGVASFLEKAFPTKVIPFVFSQSSKSKLGWDYLAVCDTGRFKDYSNRDAPSPQTEGTRDKGDKEGEEFWRQLENCEYSVKDGPGRIMSWGIPDGTRDSITGDLLHDDLILSAALCAVLDEQEWYAGGAAVMVRASDPIEAMDKEGF